MKNIIMVLDTETADLSGAVYDIGYVIADKKGQILQTRNFLVKEIFTDAKKMMGAFFAAKVFTHYAEMLEAGEIKLVNWFDIVSIMRLDCRNYNVNIVAAYNLAFDRRVMRNTHKALGFSCAVLPRMKQLDLWRFACETKLNTRLYKQVAKEQGWFSEAGNFRTTAECAFRFCRADFDFVENHTALSDALIETEIMAVCYASKKRIPYNLVTADCWRIVNPVKPKPGFLGRLFA